jgi:hypothetical protein
MKKELTPASTAAIVAAVVLVLGGLGWAYMASSTSYGSSKPGKPQFPTSSPAKGPPPPPPGGFPRPS